MSATWDRPAILCVGRLYCDLIFTDLPRMPSLGTEVFAGGLGLHAGGGAYITAAHFSALGHASALASFLPPQPFRDAVMTGITDAGVDTRLCADADAGQEPQVTVAIATGSDRAFLTRRTGPPFPALGAGDIQAVGALHVHVGELTTLVECPGIVAAAREAGATISLDCGWDDLRDASGLAELISRVDVFLPNAAEARHLASLGLGAQLAPLTVVKRGADGATALEHGRALHAAARPVVAVDTTGAGDAFNAGFLSAWLAGRPVAECLADGNATGARAISVRGGFNFGETDQPLPGRRQKGRSPGKTGS